MDEFDDEVDDTELEISEYAKTAIFFFFLKNNYRYNNVSS